MRSEDFIMMPIPSHMFVSVCALLGGASLAALNAGNTSNAVGQVASGADASGAPAAVRSTAPAPEPQGTATPASGAGSAAAEPAGNDAEVDTGGHPWSADLHASTRNKTKDGYWRMKVGVSRPADKPGFPQSAGAPTGATGTTGSGTGSEAGASASGGNAGQATEAVEDDEFAAFRAAADKASATDTAAAAAVPARKWTDTDLSALCNQAATKLGDPTPVKAVIANFVPAGEVQHSRMIPEDKRAEFAAALEKAAGITFAG